VREGINPVDVIAWHKLDGTIQPLRFKIKTDYKENIINIDQINYIDEMIVEGKKYLNYKCEGILNHKIKKFQLMFDVDTYKWYIY